MVTKIKKWRTSQGIRISKRSLHKAGLKVGDVVKVTVRDTKIKIRPDVVIRSKFSLEELLADIPKNYRPIESLWGKPMGNEIW